MKKIYCKNCEWFKFPTVNDKFKKCVHKEFIKNKEDWYGTEEYGEPSEINKNNDCKFFEFKNVPISGTW